MILRPWIVWKIVRDDRDDPRTMWHKKVKRLKSSLPLVLNYPRLMQIEDDEHFLSLQRLRWRGGADAGVDCVTKTFLCASRLNKGSSLACSLAVGVISQGRHLGADHRSRICFVGLLVPGY